MKQMHCTIREAKTQIRCSNCAADLVFVFACAMKTDFYDATQLLLLLNDLLEKGFGLSIMFHTNQIVIMIKKYTEKKL